MEASSSGPGAEGRSFLKILLSEQDLETYRRPDSPWFVSIYNKRQSLHWPSQRKDRNAPCVKNGSKAKKSPPGGDSGTRN